MILIKLLRILKVIFRSIGELGMKPKHIFNIFLVISLFITLFFVYPQKGYAASCPSGCYWNYGLEICTGYYGCGTVRTSERTYYIDGYYCDPCSSSCGTCGTCDPYTSPGCPTNYTQTNTGCSSTSISCTRSDSCGSCGTTPGTCYLVQHTVYFANTIGGYILGPSPQRVCYGGSTTYVQAIANPGYLFVRWSDGELNPYRRIVKVTKDMGVGAYFCDNSSCNPDCGDWPWTSESGSYGYYRSSGCTNDCGTYDSVSCYCTSQCTPPTCPAGTSNEGGGDLYDTSETSCTNQCGQNQTNYCYYNCSDATCSSLESKVTWTDEECSGGGCRTTTKTIDISGASPGCDTEQTKTCYIQNTRPESPNKDKPENELDLNMDLSSSINSSVVDSPSLLSKLVRKIRAQTDQDSVFDFTSNTHTGTDLNNPLRITSEYSDVDGEEDIQAVYLWWSTSDTKNFNTPNRIANPTEITLTGKTEDNENFGFMITRDETGIWENIYIPDISGPGEDERAWVYAGAISTTDSTNPVTIKGPNGLPMINFSVSVTDILGSDTVELEVLKEYIWEGTDFEKVANAQYHIWTLANDTVGFLPFDEYDDIEDSGDEFWKDSGNVWNIDLDKPQSKDDGRLAIVHLTEEDISISFGVKDNETNLSRVRLDACRTSTDGEEPRDLIVADEDAEGGYRDYDLKECSEVTLGGYSPQIEFEVGEDILDDEVTNPGAQEYSRGDISVSLTVGLNQNSNGSITFYLTFLDEAGNWSQDVRIHRLGEWAIVKDGLVYGERGVSSSTRTLNDDAIWNSAVILRQEPYGFEPTLIDITDKVLLGGKNTTTNLLRFLDRYSENRSFKAARFPGVFLESVYSNLISAYQDKMENTTSSFEEVIINGGHLSTDLLSYCNQGSPPEICILKSNKEFNNGDLIIDSNFECNGKGFIISEGNITINPDFINQNPQDACIILANGNIIIENGSNKLGTPVDYDIIQAFLIAGGEIVIERELETSNLNGILVEGGLAAFTPITESSAILNKRKISILHRNNYPALAVKHNPKYGLLSTDLFGTQTTMYQIDIGFKPY